jgi:hypothetical protein
MGILNTNKAYEIAEEIEVQTNGVTAVVVRPLSAGENISHVLARVKTPAVRSAGAVNLSVGDDDNAAGFLAAADAKAAAGTQYGNIPTERGAYLYDATVKAGYRKAYSADKSLKIVLDAAPDTQAVVQVVVIGHRMVQG